MLKLFAIMKTCSVNPLYALLESVVSAVDNFPLDGITDVRIHNAVDYVGPGNKAIRWTQVCNLMTTREQVISAMAGAGARCIRDVCASGLLPADE